MGIEQVFAERGPEADAFEALHVVVDADGHPQLGVAARGIERPPAVVADGDVDAEQGAIGVFVESGAGGGHGVGGAGGGGQDEGVAGAHGAGHAEGRDVGRAQAVGLGDGGPQGRIAELAGRDGGERVAFSHRVGALGGVAPGVVASGGGPAACGARERGGRERQIRGAARGGELAFAAVSAAPLGVEIGPAGRPQIGIGDGDVHRVDDATGGFECSGVAGADARGGCPSGGFELELDRGAHLVPGVAGGTGEIARDVHHGADAAGDAGGGGDEVRSGVECGLGGLDDGVAGAVEEGAHVFEVAGGVLHGGDGGADGVAELSHDAVVEEASGDGIELGDGGEVDLVGVVEPVAIGFPGDAEGGGYDDPVPVVGEVVPGEHDAGIDLVAFEAPVDAEEVPQMAEQGVAVGANHAAGAVEGARGPAAAGGESAGAGDGDFGGEKAAFLGDDAAGGGGDFGRGGLADLVALGVDGQVDDAVGAALAGGAGAIDGDELEGVGEPEPSGAVADGERLAAHGEIGHR